MTSLVVLYSFPVGATVQGARCGDAAGSCTNFADIWNAGSADNEVAANGTIVPGRWRRTWELVDTAQEVALRVLQIRPSFCTGARGVVCLSGPRCRGGQTLMI